MAYELVIYDLCAGTGAWSEPFKRAGFKVIRVTWPNDVRVYIPETERAYGVLAAPPCNEFSLLKNYMPDMPPDYVKGMECVNACMRIILQLRPVWWALENPSTGRLRKWLGKPSMVFNPCDYGDPWTKPTALWGNFTKPKRSPVKPIMSHVRAFGPNAEAGNIKTRSMRRAMTPPGFAKAFCLANSPGG